MKGKGCGWKRHHRTILRSYTFLALYQATKMEILVWKGAKMMGIDKRIAQSVGASAHTLCLVCSMSLYASAHFASSMTYSKH